MRADVVPFRGPVVVGALGGSGTRVVASMLMEAGLYLGSDLNRSQDNLWFTLLFKRPGWYRRIMQGDPGRMRIGFRILEKCMLTGERLDRAERSFLRRAVLRAIFRGHGLARDGCGRWGPERARSLRRSRPLDPTRYRGWGWKEPNSHHYLVPLAEHFPDLRFIYVIRHGLDMAYSGNRTQLQLWGPLFGIRPGVNGLTVPRAMLRYWIVASERAIAAGRDRLGERFLLLNFDDLCRYPGEGAATLVRFLGLDPAGIPMDRLRILPSVPATAGRYRDHDLKEFDDAELEAVRALGFSLDE